MPASPDISILNPIPQNFSCHSCGKCCVTPWKVKVDPEKVAPIRETETFRSLQRSGFVPLVVVEDGETRVGRRENHSCLFMSDGGCSIHRERGGFAKPTVCQLYPFALVNSPDGYYLSLSFSCPSVLRGEGRPLSEQIDAVKRTISESSYYSSEAMAANSHVALTQSCAMEWSEYLRVEEALVSCIGTENTMKDLLKAAASLVQYAQRQERGIWEPASFETATLQALAEKHPLFAAYTVAALERGEPEEEREILWEQLLAGERVESTLVGGCLPEFDLLGPDDSETENLVGRFVLNQILGKHLISSAPLLSRLLMLASSLSVLFFYHQASLQNPDPVRTPHGHLAWAFDLIETRLLGHTERLTPIFLEFEKLAVGVNE
jgi:Fe-S-cluster containining protein